MSVLSAAFKAEFKQALLDGKKLPTKEAFDLGMEVIVNHKLWYEYEGPCDMMLTHPENRSRLMLSARNAHKLADLIHLAGADLDQLVNSFCFEIATDPAKRAMQLNRNGELVKRANGLLPRINGAERFLTVGCGHTAAICKHAKAGGKTSSKLLKDVNGYLDVSKLKRNPKFNHMIEKGWRWKVIKADVDLQYPEFAQLAQRALNSSNSTRQPLSETEVICQLADYYADAVAEQVPDPKTTALEALQEVSRVAGYAKTLFEYAQKFGGGPDVPWIRFLDAMSKQYGTTKEFGHSFWEKILTMKFPQNDKGAHEHYPLLRLALLILQSVSDKEKDGLATFLNQTHLRKVVTKAKAAQAHELEALLTDAFEFTVIIDDDFLTTFQKEVGMLLVRAALMITDMEMKGQEEKKYSTAQLKATYLAELSKATGQTVTYSPWSAAGGATSCDAKPATPDVAAAATCAGFKDLSAYTDIQGQAKEIGYQIGNIVTEKGNEDAPNLLAIVDMKDHDNIIMQKVFQYSGEASSDKIKVSMQTLIMRWKVQKDPKIPKTTGSMQIRPDSIKIDVARADVFKALLAADKSVIKKDDQGIAFWVDPTSVRTTRLIGAGELTLMPLVPMSMITAKNNNSGTAMKVSDDPEMFIQPLPKQIQLKKDETELKPDQLAVAYWTVVASYTSNADDANMEQVVVSKGGYDFKALQNMSEIQPFTQLQVYKAPEAKPASTSKLHGAAIYTEEESKRRKIAGKTPA
jgi:hypothetical protein